MSFEQKLAAYGERYRAFLERLVGIAYLGTRKARKLAKAALLLKFPELRDWEAEKIIVDWNKRSFA